MPMYEWEVTNLSQNKGYGDSCHHQSNFHVCDNLNCQQHNTPLM